MKARTMYAEQRDRLLADLEVAFDPGVFERAYPGMTAPQRVSISGDASELAFEVIVWPVAQSVSNVRRSTCPVITTEFNLSVGLIASGATEADATNVLDAYTECVIQACMADPTLGGTTDHADPQVETGGVGTDSIFGFTAARSVVVGCRADFPINKTIARAVREAA